MNQQSLYDDLQRALKEVRNQPSEAKITGEKGLLWSQRNGWVNNLALANLVVGWANGMLGFDDDAIGHLQRANTLSKDLQNLEHVVYGYYGLATVYVRMGEFSLAIESFRKAQNWINKLEESSQLVIPVRIGLVRALMNLGYWSDAEQELLLIGEGAPFSDSELAEYQLLVLRLAFYRGDQRSIREQLQLCRELVMESQASYLQELLAYYSARFVTKYEKVKKGEAQLQLLWEKLDRQDSASYFLAFEAAQDLLQSDYPQKGLFWMSALLEETQIPQSLAYQIHLSLAHFYVAHLSHELATEHYQAAEKIQTSMREGEINLQWARYRADEAQLELRNQIDQHKKNNQILAESNALLQAVNRIALTVNASLDLESLLRRLREQLSGWIDAEVIAIAERTEDTLEFHCILEGEQRIPVDTIPLTETRSWSVRSINEGRILYENNFTHTDELLMVDSPNLARSLSFTPLKWENRVIGLLSLQSYKTDAFDSRAVSLLEYIAPVIGIAFANLLNIKRSRELSGELNKQQRELNDVRELMAHLSETDELTGLPNRASLPEHFAHWQLRAPFNGLFIKILNLDDVNTNVGYGLDEKIVRVLGQRLRNRVRPDDLLVRVASDQFLLLVESMKESTTLVEFANQLLAQCEQPLRAQEKTVAAEVCIGIVQYPDHGETLEEIMSLGGIAVTHASEDETSVFCVG